VTAILQTRPLIPAPHPEVSRLERLLRRKTIEIEILQEALDAARVKYAMGSAPANVPEPESRHPARNNVAIKLGLIEA
jgi:hypothetical protein